MELAQMSVAELRDLSLKIDALIVKRQKQDRASAIEQIYAVAHGLGMPLQTLLDGGRAKSPTQRRPGTAYQDPSNPANTWGGIGPRPAWLKGALADGVPLERLRVDAV